MIKIAIKHFIYDKCISVLFNAINRNFHIPKVKKFTADMFHEGDTYNYIKVYVNGMESTFYECSIRNAYPDRIVLICKGYVNRDKSGNINIKSESIVEQICIVTYYNIIETSNS